MNISLCPICSTPLILKARLLECGHIMCLGCAALAKLSKKCSECHVTISDNLRDSLPLTEADLQKIYSKESLPNSVVRPYVELERSLRKMRKRLNHCFLHYSSAANMMSNLKKTFESTKKSNVQAFLDEVNKVKMEMISIESFLDRGAPIKVSNELKSFSRPEEFIQSLISRLEQREKLYAVYRIGFEIKYGKLFIDWRRWRGYRLFVHSLTETKVREGVSLVSDIKDCIHSSNILTFIDVPCMVDRFPNDEVRIIFSMDVSALATQFIKICSGECGKTYKGVSFKTMSPLTDDPPMSVNGYMCNGTLQNKPIDYNFNLSVEPRSIKYLQIICESLLPYYKHTNTTCLLLQASEDGSFRLIDNSPTKQFDNIIGIMSSGFLKRNTVRNIFDCGIAIAIKQYDIYKIVPSDMLRDIPYAKVIIDYD